MNKTKKAIVSQFDDGEIDLFKAVELIVKVRSRNENNLQVVIACNEQLKTILQINTKGHHNAKSNNQQR